MTGTDEQTVKIREALTGVAKRNGLAGPAEAAIAFVVRHPARGLPIIGTGKQDRMDDAIKAASLELDRMDWYEVVTATSPMLEL